jgi:hypothetical protein
LARGIRARVRAAARRCADAEPARARA